MKRSKTEELQREIDKNEFISIIESKKNDASFHKSFINHNKVDNKWNYKDGNHTDSEFLDNVIYLKTK